MLHASFRPHFKVEFGEYIAELRSAACFLQAPPLDLGCQGEGRTLQRPGVDHTQVGLAPDGIALQGRAQVAGQHCGHRGKVGPDAACAQVDLAALPLIDHVHGELQGERAQHDIAFVDGEERIRHAEPQAQVKGALHVRQCGATCGAQGQQCCITDEPCVVAAAGEPTRQAERIAAAFHFQPRAIVPVTYLQLVEAHLPEVDGGIGAGAVRSPDDVIGRSIAVQCGSGENIAGVDLLHGIVPLEKVPQAELKVQSPGMEKRVGQLVIASHLHGEHVGQPHAGPGEARNERKVHVTYGDRCHQVLVEGADQALLHFGLIHDGKGHQQPESGTHHGAQHEGDGPQPAQHPVGGAGGGRGGHGMDAQGIPVHCRATANALPFVHSPVLLASAHGAAPRCSGHLRCFNSTTSLSVSMRQVPRGISFFVSPAKTTRSSFTTS